VGGATRPSLAAVGFDGGGPGWVHCLILNRSGYLGFSCVFFFAGASQEWGGLLLVLVASW